MIQRSRLRKQKIKTGGHVMDRETNIKEEFFRALSACYDVIEQVDDLERRIQTVTDGRGNSSFIVVKKERKHQKKYAVILPILVGGVGLLGGMTRGGVWILLYTLGYAALGFGAYAFLVFWEKFVIKLMLLLNSLTKAGRERIETEKFAEEISTELQQEMDDLIVSKWFPYKEKADALARDAYYRMGLYKEEYEGVLRADEYIKSVTSDGKYKTAQRNIVKGTLKVVGGITAVVTVGTIGMMRSAGKDFGIGGGYQTHTRAEYSDGSIRERID
jgi:hypothetical protein